MASAPAAGSGFAVICTGPALFSLRPAQWQSTWSLRKEVKPAHHRCASPVSGRVFVPLRAGGLDINPSLEIQLMKKYLVMLCIVAAVAGASSFVVAQDDNTGEKRFVLHGEVRQRADYNENLFDFNDDSSDSFLFFPYRARIAAEGHFGKGVIGYIEMQGFGFWGDVPPIKDFAFGPVGGENPDSPVTPVPFFPANLTAETNNGQQFSNDIELYQAFINLTEIGGSKWDVKIGRQEIVRGTEFLLGDNDFYDGISHDALMGSWNAEHFSLDIWWARPLQSPDAVFDGIDPPMVPDHQSINFYGGYLNW